MFGDTSETMLENGANSFEPGRKDEADDEDDLAINNLSPILTDADEDSLYELPKHWRCAAHTLNQNLHFSQNLQVYSFTLSQ